MIPLLGRLRDIVGDGLHVMFRSKYPGIADADTRASIRLLGEVRQAVDDRRPRRGRRRRPGRGRGPRRPRSGRRRHPPPRGLRPPGRPPPMSAVVSAESRVRFRRPPTAEFPTTGDRSAAVVGRGGDAPMSVVVRYGEQEPFGEGDLPLVMRRLLDVERHTDALSITWVSIWGRHARLAHRRQPTAPTSSITWGPPASWSATAAWEDAAAGDVGTSSRAVRPTSSRAPAPTSYQRPGVPRGRRRVRIRSPASRRRR